MQHGQLESDAPVQWGMKDRTPWGLELLIVINIYHHYYCGGGLTILRSIFENPRPQGLP